MGQPRPEPVAARRQVKPPHAPTAVDKPPAPTAEPRARRGQGHPLVDLSPLPGQRVRRRVAEPEPGVSRVGHVRLVGHRGCDLALGVRPIHDPARPRPGRQDAPLEHKVDVERERSLDSRPTRTPSAPMFARSCPRSEINCHQAIYQWRVGEPETGWSRLPWAYDRNQLVKKVGDGVEGVGNIVGR
jgi:hypothetical protein